MIPFTIYHLPFTIYIYIHTSITNPHRLHIYVHIHIHTYILVEKFPGVWFCQLIAGGTTSCVR